MSHVQTQVANVASEVIEQEVAPNADISFVIGATIDIEGVGLDAADGVFNFEESTDGITWVDVPSLAITMASGDSTQNATYPTTGPKYRLKWTPNSVTTGVIKINYTGED